MCSDGDQYAWQSSKASPDLISSESWKENGYSGQSSFFENPVGTAPCGQCANRFASRPEDTPRLGRRSGSHPVTPIWIRCVCRQRAALDAMRRMLRSRAASMRSIALARMRHRGRGGYEIVARIRRSHDHRIKRARCLADRSGSKIRRHGVSRWPATRRGVSSRS